MTSAVRLYEIIPVCFRLWCRDFVLVEIDLELNIPIKRKIRESDITSVAGPCTSDGCVTCSLVSKLNKATNTTLLDVHCLYNTISEVLCVVASIFDNDILICGTTGNDRVCKLSIAVGSGGATNFGDVFSVTLHTAYVRNRQLNSLLRDNITSEQENIRARIRLCELASRGRRKNRHSHINIVRKHNLGRIAPCEYITYKMKCLDKARHTGDHNRCSGELNTLGPAIALDLEILSPVNNFSKGMILICQNQFNIKFQNFGFDENFGFSLQGCCWG